MLLKIVTAALDRFPQFASSLDMANNAIVLKKYRHLGVAVDTPNGLLVPVIRDVDQKTMTEIAVELATRCPRRRANKKLGLDDMAGGVFTISNLGGHWRHGVHAAHQSARKWRFSACRAARSSRSGATARSCRARCCRCRCRTIIA